MKNKLYLFLVLAFFSLLLFLGSWGLTESSEGRYATISKEMLINNDFINPTLLGIKHLHKPPVTYYITALGFKIFGINEFGARFFMQLALIIQILLVYKITRILYRDEKLALAASLIYFSLPITVIAVRTLTTDAYLTTFILASIYFWLQYAKSLKVVFLYLFYLFLGLIFETKGPVGFLVPITFVITYKIIHKEKINTGIHQWLGLGLFLLISASWYILVIWKNEGLLDYFINTQLVERVADNKFKRDKPFWYYFVYMPLIGLPWLFYLIPFVKKKAQKILQKKGTDFILISTFLVLFIVMNLSASKLILYILPLYFIIAIFSAKYLRKSSSNTIQFISAIYVGLIAFITASLLIAPYVIKDLNNNPITSLLIFIIFTLSGFLLFKKMKNTDYLKPAYLGVLFLTSIIMSSNIFFNENESKVNSIKPVAKFIKEHTNRNSEVVVYNYLLPSLSFYLDKEIITINNGNYRTQREVQFQNDNLWKENLINYRNLEDRERLLVIDETKNIVLVIRNNPAIPDTLQAIKSKLKNQKKFEKFSVYY